MSQQKVLYRLQRIDLDLDKRRARLREITAALEQDSVLRQAQTDVDTFHAALAPQQARAKDLTLEIQSVVEQNRQLSDRLYGGTVHNPKELQDIQDKIAELKRRHASLENTLLETMISVEELEGSLAGAKARLDEVRATRGDELKALLDEQHRLKREIKSLKTDREAVVQEVSEDNLALYQELRTKRQGHAVALLQGETCSGCHVDQTTVLVQKVRQGQALIRCASCGRILVAI